MTIDNLSGAITDVGPARKSDGGKLGPMAMPASPCPLPRCSLEWAMAGLMVVIGLMIGTLAGSSTVVHALSFGYGTRPSEVRVGWLFLLVGSGVGQAMALWTRRAILQRWSACWSGVVFSIMSLCLWEYQVMTVVAGITIWASVAEFFIYWMLRGARWSHGMVV